MKVFGSSLLALAFIVSPIAPAFDDINAIKFSTVKVAEAKAISYGSISGVVNLASSTTPVEGMVINLFLKDSNTLAQSTKTDANGMFNFVAVEEEAYRVDLAGADGYVVKKNSPSSVEIKSLVNSYSAISFEVVELPFIKMFGGNEVTIEKGAKFEDPGVIFQKKDGSIVTGYAISSEGKVDTSKVGKYTITYSIDKAATGGYLISNIIRTVNVVEKKVGGLTVLPVTVTASSKNTVTSAPSKVYLNSYLGKSFSNDKLEVIKLQAFLAFKEGNTNVKATGVYDAATELAVRNFQDKYFKDILLPYGTEDNTGEVRMLTLKKINDLMSGTVTAFTKDQEKALAIFKNASHVSMQPKVAVDVKEVPLVVPEEKTFTSKISSWWSGVKKSLMAVLPFGHKDEKKNDFTASGTVARADDSSIDLSATGTDNMASAKAVKESKFSVVATIISAILGFAAFVLAFYIYRKTRGPALVEAVVEEKKSDKKK